MAGLGPNQAAPALLVPLGLSPQFSCFLFQVPELLPPHSDSLRSEILKEKRETLPFSPWARGSQSACALPAPGSERDPSGSNRVSSASELLRAVCGKASRGALEVYLALDEAFFSFLFFWRSPFRVIPKGRAKFPSVPRGLEGRAWRGAGHPRRREELPGSEEHGCACTNSDSPPPAHPTAPTSARAVSSIL